MLSSWSSTIITVFGISHLLESSVGEPRRGGVRARLRTARSESLVPIRYRNANNDLRPRAAPLLRGAQGSIANWLCGRRTRRVRNSISGACRLIWHLDFGGPPRKTFRKQLMLGRL